MTKKIKQILGVVMAAMLCFALTPTAAFAANNQDTTGKITLNNAVEGQTYEIYRILDLESYNGTAYIYRVAENWGPFLAEGAEGAKYLSIADGGYVEWKNAPEGISPEVWKSDRRGSAGERPDKGNQRTGRF